MYLVKNLKRLNKGAFMSSLLKKELLRLNRKQLECQHERNDWSEASAEGLLQKELAQEICTIGNNNNDEQPQLNVMGGFSHGQKA